ncbi:hypothetical protein GCM10010441_63600 [Kitasatospora paracochleata]|uniref:Leucine rich repeat (LRR) protein n=1 Tax=Kitasatospora paracochleata TaxID=58354 RepID=A0ABT1IV23_9ACTN|nr:hypothetical protein [Kitasatospora paracochleata]MCP2308804.1 hypothetical protein [Kitasatospora paracochleata]
MNDVLVGLAANPSLPAELIDRLIALGDEEVAHELAYRADLTRPQVLALAAAGEGAAIRLARAGRLTAGDVDPAARPDAALALLDEGAGPPAWARLFAADPLAERREELAGCPWLPADVVELLAADHATDVVAELAWSVRSPQVLARLAAHPHLEVRRHVAGNPATPPAQLAALATGDGLPPARSCEVCDREPIPFVHPPDCPRPHCALPPGAACDGGHQSATRALHHCLLENPATPVAAVLRFAEHPSALLRAALAGRPDLPDEVSARLAADGIPLVRIALARNPAIGEALCRRLREDDYQEVRYELAHNPAVPLDVLTGLATTTRTGPAVPARIAAASEAEIAELAVRPQAGVRLLVAQRRDLPAGVRDALADDPDAKVVRAVLAHPGLSAQRLRAAVDRFGDKVAAGAAANPDATAALLEHLAGQRPPARKALREIARHPAATAAALLPCLDDPKARRHAAGHPALPPATITALLADGDYQVAGGAAANPSLPRAEMFRLLEC